MWGLRYCEDDMGWNILEGWATRWKSQLGGVKTSMFDVILGLVGTAFISTLPYFLGTRIFVGRNGQKRDTPDAFQLSLQDQILS